MVHWLEPWVLESHRQFLAGEWGLPLPPQLVTVSGLCCHGCEAGIMVALEPQG